LYRLSGLSGSDTGRASSFIHTIRSRFARLSRGQATVTKEGDAVGGTRLTIEIGAEFPIGISATHALAWTAEWADSRGSEGLQAPFLRCGSNV
jgi:hypothetical protein